jgi:hypothetical protein
MTIGRTTYRVRIHRQHGLLTGLWLAGWSMCWWMLAACWWLLVAAVCLCWLAVRWLVARLSTSRSRSSGAHSSLVAAAEQRTVSDLVAQEQAEVQAGVQAGQSTSEQTSVPVPVRL